MRNIYILIVLTILSLFLVGCNKEKLNEESYKIPQNTDENIKEIEENKNQVDLDDKSMSESDNAELNSNNIDPIEVVSSIIPYGNFELDREELKDGVDYFVVRCTDPENNSTIGWYFVRKDDGKLFEWNLANNTLIEVEQSNLDYESDNYQKLLGHWAADNGVEYWYGDGYAYSNSISGLSKENIIYMSKREEIVNCFKAFNEANFIYGDNIYNFTDVFLVDEIIDNCIVLQYPIMDDFLYQEILIFEDENTIDVISKIDYNIFSYSGVKSRIDDKTKPN